MKDLGYPWLTIRLNENLVLAKRRETGKLIIIYEETEKTLSKEDLIRFWVDFGIHPFTFNNNKYYDLLSEEFINKI